MAEHQLPKLNTRVRFPSPAPRRKFFGDAAASQARPQTSVKKLPPSPHETHFVGLSWGPQRGFSFSPRNPLHWAFAGAPEGERRENKVSGCSAVGSALGSGPRGRVFKSPHSDHVERVLKIRGSGKPDPLIGQNSFSFFPRNPFRWASVGALGAKSCDPIFRDRGTFVCPDKWSGHNSFSVSSRGVIGT